jgi:aminomethyltransferase
VALAPADREFVGRAALERIRAAGVARLQVGLLLEGRGVLRGHQRVILPPASGVPQAEGEVTSGSFSPTLEQSIALARVPATAAERVEVEIRGKRLAARIVKPPFVRFGKPLVH